jgi:hypothetical protein
MGISLVIWDLCHLHVIFTIVVLEDTPTQRQAIGFGDPSEHHLLRGARKRGRARRDSRGAMGSWWTQCLSTTDWAPRRRISKISPEGILFPLIFVIILSLHLVVMQRREEALRRGVGVRGRMCRDWTRRKDRMVRSVVWRIRVNRMGGTLWRGIGRRFFGRTEMATWSEGATDPWVLEEDVLVLAP